jgi:hypothetical protein
MRKLSPKQEKTIDRMKDLRIQSALKLKEIIKQKLLWISDTKIQRVSLIEKLKKDIIVLEDSLKNLNGAEIALKDVLEESNKKSEEPKVETKNA